MKSTVLSSFQTTILSCNTAKTWMKTRRHRSNVWMRNYYFLSFSAQIDSILFPPRDRAHSTLACGSTTDKADDWLQSCLSSCAHLSSTSGGVFDGMKELWTTLASLMGVLAFCQSLLQTAIPPELRFLIVKIFQRFFNYFSSFCYFDITEVDGFSTNELYNAVQLYLSSSASVSGNRLSLTRALNSTTFTFGLSNNDRIVDTFKGATASWEHVVTQRQTQSFSWRPVPEEKRRFTLRILKKDKPVILHTYLDHIMERASEIRRKNQDRLLYTNSRSGSMESRGNPWESVPFNHPSTFDTLAMDPEKKNEIREDLKDFVDGKKFYQNAGRAWKRGYLLYGPPGTGKSSMIAAMANFLGYDIYDLELTEVHTNSELRKLLMKTTSKSIIVIEDIDCSANLGNRTGGKPNPNPNPSGVVADNMSDPASVGGGGTEETAKSITLSGLLNFTDGLWSCCGSERLFVFTTNHIERLDPALLRSGRMDMHIFMSHCTFPSLKILMKNYLGWIDGDGEEEEEEEEGLLHDLEEVVCAAEMTPADVSEVLIKNRRKDKYIAMSKLLQVLKHHRSQKKKKKKKTSDEEEECNGGNNKTVAEKSAGDED